MRMTVVAKRFNTVRSRALLLDLLDAVRENWELVLLALFLLAGMVCGAFYARNAGMDAISRLDFLFSGNFKARISEPVLLTFTASFASSFLFLFACFLCGLSMWGAFFIPLILIFRGFGLGLTSGYLYSAYGIKGILFNFSVILPGAFFCCLALLLAAREGIRLSHRLSAVSCSSDSVNKAQMKLYVLRFGEILALAFFAALIDLLLSVSFGGLFSF